MSTNVQVGVITCGKEEVKITDGGTMQIGTTQIGTTQIGEVCIPTHDGFLNKDGRIIENANENAKGR